MKIVTVPAFTKGVDTFSVLTDASCKAIVNDGCTFVVRYLDNLTSDELQMILAHGLIVSFVHSCRVGGWIPTELQGMEDGQRDVLKLQALQVPTGCHVFFDLEGASSDPSKHVNAHGGQLKLHEYLPGLYVGQSNMLTPQGMYALVSELYWRSCSNVLEPDVCGYAFDQVYRPNNPLGPTLVDYNFAHYDRKMRQLVGVAL